MLFDDDTEMPQTVQCVSCGNIFDISDGTYDGMGQFRCDSCYDEEFYSDDCEEN